ncbi:MAG: hypothetical protein ACFE96_10780, partial [Candidatus Hermodarchaeota archaeon]
SVGNANRIDPAFLVEEELDFLIIGDIIEEEIIPSPEIQDWFNKFSELCDSAQLIIKSISGYCVCSPNFDVNHYWINLFQQNNLSLTIFPPILKLNIKKGGLTLENNVLQLVKDYSNDFIEFLIKDKGGI